ncbi:MAG: MerR family transcriptional regulator [Pseudomonadota bacterium]
MQNITNFDDVANLLNVKKHVLKLWIKKFPVLELKKSPSGKLGLTPRDISLAKGFKHLILHEKKSIAQVQKILKERGIAYVAAYGKEKFVAEHSSSSTPRDTLKLLINKDKQQLTPSQATTNLVNSQLDDVFQRMSSLKEGVSSLEDIKAEPLETPNEDIIEDKNSLALDEDAGYFEEEWRKFMRNQGKAIAAADIRSPNENDVENHIDITVEDNNLNEERGLSVYSEEKMEHILSKLDDLKAELTTTKDVITQTLKAFGYAGFDNAYSRHDNKSVY